MTNHRSSDDEALIVGYLLGTASEEETAQLEERFFADDDLFLEVKAIEDELLYEYAQGGLKPDQRKRIEERFLTKSEYRDRVANAKVLLQKAFEVRKETAALAPAPEKPSLWRSLASWLTPQRLAYSTGAAALAMLSFGSWMMLRTLELKDQVEQAKAARVRAEQELAKERVQEADLKRQLENQRPPSPESRGVFGFALLPGLSRGAGDEMKRLVLPPAGVVDVSLELEVRKGKAPRYRAELQNLDGDVLWSQTVAHPPKVSIPANLFRAGDYVVVLKGLPAAAGGEPEDAGEFYFQVVRR